MTGRDLLLIGAGKMGLGYLTAARRLGVPVRVVEYPAFVARSTELAQRVMGATSMLEQSWYADALAVTGADRPAGVIAFTEPHVLPAALLQDVFGLPGPGLHAAVVSRDKALQRALFGHAGVRQPPYRLVTRLAEATDWAAEHFPVVVKPLHGSGSDGVELIADPADFAAATGRRDGAGSLLVEQAVDGPEFSAECLVQDGNVLFVNLTAKQTTGPPYFVEVCHRPGHRFVRGQQDEVTAFVADVLRALQMRAGIAHVEFRYTAEGPVLMEVAVRTPGDFLMEAVSLTWGFDLFEAVVQVALGRPVGVPGPGSWPSAAAASRFLFADPGRVSAVTGTADVEAHPAVVRCVLNVGPGDEVVPVRSSLHRVGHVLVHGAGPADRDAALDLVDARLRVNTAPD